MTTEPESYSAEQLVERVRDLLERCEYGLALKFARRALDLDPEDAETLYVAGLAAIEAGQSDLGRKRLLKAVEVQPESGFEKFMLLGQLSTSHEAVAFFKRGAEVMGQYADALSESDDDDDLAAVADLRRRIASALVAATEIYLTDLCFENDAEENCEKFLSQAEQIDPGNSEVLQTMASVRMSQQRPEEAKQCLEKSMARWFATEGSSDSGEKLDLQAPPFEFRVNAVKLLLELHEFDVATQVLSALRDENDASVDVWYLFGWCYYSELMEIMESQGGTADGDNGEHSVELRESALECFKKAVEVATMVEYDDSAMVEHAQSLIVELAEGNGTAMMETE